jgi:hypothetical protein
VPAATALMVADFQRLARAGAVVHRLRWRRPGGRMPNESPNRNHASGRAVSAAVAIAVFAGASAVGGCIGDIGGAGDVGVGDGPPSVAQG